jgi:hypothetical protein
MAKMNDVIAETRPQPGTPAEIASEQKALSDRLKQLAEQLAAGKDSELEKLSKAVGEFNRIFNESYSLQLGVKPKAARKCSLCHQPGHRARQCTGIATA